MNTLEEAAIYTNLDDARVEINKRWNDKVLRKKVEEYIGDIPEVFSNAPRATLCRHIITPDNELDQFIKLAQETDLQPLGLEYTSDIFSTNNSDKLALGKLAFFEGRKTDGEAKVRYRKIIDLPGSENKKFSDIHTLWGESLVDFHHRLLLTQTRGPLEVHDMSSWLVTNGATASQYYKKILALFICHGILFESFITDESEAKFERNVVLPAFKMLEQKFGLKPLVVNLIPDTADMFWWCYQPHVAENDLGF